MKKKKRINSLWRLEMVLEETLLMQTAPNNGWSSWLSHGTAGGGFASSALGD